MIAAGVALGTIALLALIAGRAEYVAVAPLGTFVLLIAILANLATALILVTMWHPWQPERAVTTLAFGYVAMGALEALTSFLLPVWSGGPALIPANAQAAPWLYCCAHVGLAVAALAYAWFRSHEPGHGTTRRFALIAGAATATYIVASAVAAFGFGDALPHLVVDGTLGGLRSTGAGPVAALLLAFGAWRALRIRPSAEIDQALGFGLLVLAAEVIVNVINAERFTLAWYVSRCLMGAGSLAVLVAAIRTLVRSRSTLVQTQAALTRSEDESLQRAERIRTLGRIASNDVVPEDLWVRSIIAAAAATMRPHHRICALLAHVDGGSAVIDEAAWAGPEAAEPDSPLVHAGATVTLAGSVFGDVVAAGRTGVWADLDELPVAGPIRRQFGWRSLIATAVNAGRTTYVLAFGSPEPMLDEPFAEDDVAYVDVLASFVAHRFSERQQRERLQYQIEHDALTGLRNRAQFRSALRLAVAEGEPFAIAFIDLDDFTALNQTAGHMVADELLVEVAISLDHVAEGDFVARLSGDDFAVILPGVDSGESIEERLRRYADVFRYPFHTGDREGTRMLSVTASIGAALYDADGTTAEELIRATDVALVAAKERGGGAALRFAPAMLGRLERAYVKSVELSDAIDGGGLELVYQPTFDLATRAIVGAEALVRWNHPTRGLLMPADFIDFAERNGLIGRLTRWVMNRVVADLERLPEIPHDFRAYFNLATTQLDDLRFIAELESQLRSAPRLANHLGVEITETAAINTTDNSLYAIDRFRRLGLRVAIDDFGTGYSSLSYLKRLPVDMIKIDRSFVSGLPDDDKDAALCDLLLQIAGRFGLVALAEGIETEAQRDWLRDHECVYGQGYLVSRPVPFVELARLLAASPMAVSR